MSLQELLMCSFINILTMGIFFGLGYYRVKDAGSIKILDLIFFYISLSYFCFLICDVYFYLTGDAKPYKYCKMFFASTILIFVLVFIISKIKPLILGRKG